MDGFFDRFALRELDRLVHVCPADGPPALELRLGERLIGARALGVLPGSFNPLTEAHVGLADAAERAGLGPSLFVLSTRTVDKERLEGALLADRLLVLELHARRRQTQAVGLINRGLYVDQAALLRAHLPEVEELTFLVGFDKILQIFDPRYYAERDAALRRLFGLASFAVAPRAGAGRAELDELLERPENRAFASQVRSLEVDSDLAEVSSSAIRAALAAGRPLPPGLPPETAAFIRATGCYGPPERSADGSLVDGYAVGRARLLGR